MKLLAAARHFAPSKAQQERLDEEKEGFAPVEGDVVAYVPSGHR